MVAHSYGCALTYHFLLDRPLPWRRRFVKHVVLLAAELGGFAEGMNDLASGIDYGLPPGAGLASMRRLARSQQNTLWRLPTPLVFGDRTLVVTKNKNYSACNVAEYLRAIGFAGGIQPYVTRVLPLWQALPAPMVPVTSIVEGGVRTPNRFVYVEGGLEGTPEVEFGDGDGDINLVSLLAIEKEWTGVRGQVLKMVRLLSVSHTGVLTVGFALNRVVAELYEANVNSIPMTMTMHEGS